VYVLYLYHPIVAITNLWIHEMYVLWIVPNVDICIPRALERNIYFYNHLKWTTCSLICKWSSFSYWL